MTNQKKTQAWQRPEGSNPVCYYKFVSGNEKCDKLVEYKIRDIPENRYEEACKFMLSYFVPYEPKLVARNAQNDQSVLDDCHYVYMRALQQKVSVACFKRGSDEFVGINILEVLERDRQTNDNNCSYKSQTFRDNSEVCKYVLDRADICNRYDVDNFLSGTALAIHPDYRKHGIATEMLKARSNLMKCLGLSVTSTGFASIGAQKAAKNAGFQEDYAISYDELSKIMENWDFRNSSGSDMYIQMSMRSH